MRLINKTNPVPPFFIADTNYTHNNDWSTWSSTKKRRFKSHALEHEQGYLCCYCEKKIDLNNSHCEHIKPKSIYINETFVYTNLIVSCQGDHCNTDGSLTQQICGHNKDNDYCEIKFLDPTICSDISSHFMFDISGVIYSSGKDCTRANYTINLLNLNGNNGSLALARKRMLDTLISEAINAGLTPEDFHIELGTISEYATFLSYIFNVSND